LRCEQSLQARSRIADVAACRHERLGIPRAFQLHGHIITVRILPLSRWPHSKMTVGMWEPNLHRIDLRNDLGETELQAVFCHELIHCLLDSFNHKLSYDEVFVDILGTALAQALSSFTYGRPRATAKSN
jgi:hypothetical protein